MKKFLLTILIYASVLGPTFYYLPRVGQLQTEKRPFDKEMKEEIQQIQPEYVFIGNSMVESRISKRIIQEETGKNAFLFHNQGSGSSQWYLFFKNFVVDLESKPKVFIFFRSSYLTDPEYNIDFNYDKYIEPLQTDNEERYYEIINSGNNSFQEKTDLKLNNISFTDIVNQTKQHSSIAILGIQNTRYFLEDLNYQFHYKNNRVYDFDPSSAGSNFDFKSNFSDSFLPEIITLAKENGIDLVFIKIKRFPDENGVTFVSEEERQYSKDAEEYIKSEGFSYYDFSSDTNIPREWYSDPTHIKETKKYTEYLLTKLSNEFE